MSNELDADGIKNYQLLIGTLQWLVQLYCPNMSQAGKNKWQVQACTSTEETIENLSLYIILYYKGQPYIYLVISMIQSSLVYEAYLHDDIGPIGHINNPMKGGR